MGVHVGLCGSNVCDQLKCLRLSVYLPRRRADIRTYIQSHVVFTSTAWRKVGGLRLRAWEQGVSRDSLTWCDPPCRSRPSGQRRAGTCSAALCNKARRPAAAADATAAAAAFAAATAAAQYFHGWRGHREYSITLVQRAFPGPCPGLWLSRGHTLLAAQYFHGMVPLNRFLHHQEGCRTHLHP